MAPPPTRPSKKVRQHVELWLLKTGLLLIPLLPRKAIVNLARGLGGLVFRCSKRLRRLGLANLEIAFADSKTVAERENILRESFRNFALMLLDLLWFQRHTEKRLSEWVKLDLSTEPFFTDAPQLCVTAHFGNWEILGQTVSMKGYPLLSVAAPLQNPMVDQLFHKMRTATGQQVVPKQGALRPLLKSLRGTGKVGLLLDQNTHPQEGGLFVDFFKLRTPVSAAGATLSLRTGCAVLFGFCTADRAGCYTIYMASSLPAAPPEKSLTEQQVLERTREITRQVEAEILKNPAYWLWAYKRFKHFPVEEDPTPYPYYSEPYPDPNRPV